MTKPINIIILLFVLYPSITKAQLPIDTFFTKGSVFVNKDVFPAIAHNHYSTRYFRFTIGDDSTYNNKKYRIVYASQESWHEDKVIGGIRTSNDSVFYQKWSYIPKLTLAGPNTNLTHGLIPDSVEVLLFKYDVKVGDTLDWMTKYGYWKKHIVSTIVTKIDSIKTNSGRYVKRYVFGHDDYYWLRGMGTTRGLFGTYSSVLIKESKALCYFSNHTVHSFGEKISYCYPTNIEDKTHEAIKPKIYPNPISSGDLKVVLPSHTDALIIYNISGKVVYKRNSLSKGTHTISLSVPNGLYIVHIVDKESTYNIKLEKF